jgi:uncharacterized protein YegP (UPF0339 family)
MAHNEPEFYRDNRGEWRWRVQDLGNNEIVDASSEGFASKEKAQQNYALGLE